MVGSKIMRNTRQKALTSFITGEDIPVEENWSFTGSNTQYATHGIHTYLAAMIPKLAERLIRRFVPEEGCVLDPFCGGGAVLVECLLNKIPAVGTDINPLSILISRTKTTYIEKDRLFDCLHKVLDSAHSDKEPPMTFIKIQMIHFWFKDYMLSPLSALARAVRSIKDLKLRNFFETVFSATVRDVSLTHRHEIRLRRLDGTEFEKFNPDIFNQFDRRARLTIKRVSTLPKQPNIHVQQGDVMHLPFNDDSFTTIICSPPYGDERNGVPYFQFAKNMLFWLGMEHEKYLKLKKGTLGARNKDDVLGECPPSKPLSKVLERIPPQKQAYREAVAFYYDYWLALQELVRVTTDKIIIVIGHRALENTVIDNAAITTSFLERLGVKKINHFLRKIPSKRLPKMREFGAAIDTEHILVYQLKK